MAYADVLKSVPLFAGLPEGQLAALARVASVRSFRRGTFILRAGERPDGLYILLAGRAKVLMFNEAGREVILATLGPREFFGEMSLLDDSPRCACVQTLAPCEAMCLPTADFMRCLSASSGLAMCIMRELAGRLRHANRQIEGLALLDVHGRVARVLLDLAEDVDGEWVVQKAPANQEIAHMIGASREMVSRVIKDLRDYGHVRVDKRRIVLLDNIRAPLELRGQ